MENAKLLGKILLEARKATIQEDYYFISNQYPETLNEFSMNDINAMIDKALEEDLIYKIKRTDVLGDNYFITDSGEAKIKQIINELKID